MKAIPVEISARHIHLSQAHVEALFGKGHVLTKHKDLSQPGQYAAVEQVDVCGPKGEFKGVRVLGPARPESQLEVSATDTRKLGIPSSFRHSGDTKGTPGVKFKGPKGEVTLEQGAIIALRHLHCDPASAQELNVKDRQNISIRIPGARGLVFENVLVRVNKDFALAFHVDTDEGNAAGLEPGVTGSLV